MGVQISSTGFMERTGRRWLKPALDAVGPALTVAGNATGVCLQKMGLVDPPGPKTLPPNLVKDLPPVVMDQPMLVMPGYNTSRDRFNPLVQQLAQPGHNGERPYYLKGGQVFLDHDCTQSLPSIPSSAKVFVLFPENGADPPPVAAQQLAICLAAIQQATGAGKVDVTAYSMGGLTTRYYLQQGGQAVGKFLMVGTPNQGSQLSEAALKTLDLHDRGWPVSWIMARKPMVPSHREALTWLLPPGSEYAVSPLVELNRNWPKQAAAVEKVGVVGSCQVKTFDTDFWRVPGDGQVTTESLGLPGLTPTLLESVPYPKHRFLFSNPELQAECKSFFGWRDSA